MLLGTTGAGGHSASYKPASEPSSGLPMAAAAAEDEDALLYGDAAPSTSLFTGLINEKSIL